MHVARGLSGGGDMSEHTPGPWDAYPPDQGCAPFPYCTIASADGHVIAGVRLTDVFSHPLPYEANARLIASAPEMLSALKASIKLADRNEWKKGAGGKVPRTPKCQAVYDQCVAAIKKAEGI